MHNYRDISGWFQTRHMEWFLPTSKMNNERVTKEEEEEEETLFRPFHFLSCWYRMRGKCWSQPMDTLTCVSERSPGVSNNLDYCFVPFRCVSKTLIVPVSQRWYYQRLIRWNADSIIFIIYTCVLQVSDRSVLWIVVVLLLHGSRQTLLTHGVVRHFLAPVGCYMNKGLHCPLDTSHPSSGIPALNTGTSLLFPLCMDAYYNQLNTPVLTLPYGD